MARGSRSTPDPERARNVRIERSVQRQLRAEGEKATRDAVRDEKERERARRAAEREAGEADAARRTEEWASCVAALESILRRCVAAPPFRIEDLGRTVTRPFDPGSAGRPRRAPVAPTLPRIGLFTGRRVRDWHARETARHERAVAAYQADEMARQTRLAALGVAYERQESERAAAARARERRLRRGLDAGEGSAVEDVVSAVVGSLPVTPVPDLVPRVVYRDEPREVFVDLSLPAEDVVPRQRSATYVASRSIETVKDRPVAEREAIYRRVLAQLPLAVADGVFRALDVDLVETVTVNGRLAFTDPSTGRQVDDVLVSLSVERTKFEGLVLDAEGLDPVRCLRGLDARLSQHPLARETVPALLTFDEAKYKLGSSVDVAAGLDGRPNLGSMPWQDFEQLVRQLLLAMQGQNARVTRGSRDDGIDGVVFDCRPAIGGEYIVQAKRYKNVVPALDVRALAGTMHDKRANLALFVTTSWFSPDGRRFAGENRVRLIEGPELRHLLLELLDLDVLIPEQRPRRRPEP